VILCRGDRIGPDLLPPRLVRDEASPRAGDPVTLEALEEQHIRRVLAAAGSLQEAAAALGIDQATLWRRRKKYGI
jgi:two-component system, NtrC family, response regulator AlgB